MSSSGITLFLARCASVLVLLGALVACSKPQIDWREEVRLRSGETVVVKRTARLKSNDVAGGGGGSFNEGMTVEIAQPARPDNPTVWSAKFVPVILDRDPITNEWFLVATFFHCDSWNALGRPKLPYTEYRFKNGQWMQQDLSSQWIGAPANMFTGMGPNWNKDLTVAEKASRMNDPTILPQFRVVIDRWIHGC